MTKAELESKHLSELHSLAAEAGVERYRMLTRTELVEQLAGDDAADGAPGREPRSGPRDGEGSGAERPRRRRRRSSRPKREEGSDAGAGDAGQASGAAEAAGAEQAAPRRSGSRSRPAASEPPARQPESAPPSRSAASETSPRQPESAPPPAAAPATGESTRPRRRRRRRFGRRGKQGVTLQGLLLPPEAGRQAVLAAESREGCTALLRSVAADLATDSKGPDPVALLIDPSPEELADWRRDAPQAEIVAAGQPRHADDALAQAKARAAAGEDIILLVDSLTRLGEAYGDADAAKDFFDAGRGATGGGSLTVVAALERS